MKATLVTHQGWADHFSCNGLVNHYSSIFDEVLLFAANEGLAEMLRAVYSEMRNIRVVVPRYVSHDHRSLRGETCIKCHTQGSSSACPRGSGICQYIDYSSYSGFENIKIGAFKGFPDWGRFVQESRQSFAHCFYSYESLSPDLRIDNFRISRVEQLKPPKNPYAAIHDDPDRGIKLGNVSTDNCIQLNQLSRVMIDTISILENASEIRVIDSNYSVLVHLLSFHNAKIASIPKYLHASARSSRDIEIYFNPTPKMWSVL